MTLTAWRVVNPRYAPSAFDGEGAAFGGGRWTSAGRRAVYVADSIALALLEVFVHEPLTLLPSYEIFPVSFDAGEMETVEAGLLPRDWRAPVAPAANRALGDAWLDRARLPVLRVPSAVVPRSWNFVLNPAHPRFGGLAVGAGEVLTIDPRLRRR